MLAALKRAGLNQSEIARQLQVDKSTISRKLSRHKINNVSGYDAWLAQQATEQKRFLANQHFRKIEHNSRLRRCIIRKIKKYWSPEQIAGRLQQNNKNKAVIGQVTIYQFIYSHRPDLKKYLRCQKGKYRLRHGSKQRIKQREFNKKKWIAQRPAMVETRARLGDWEGDLIIGQERTTAIMTHVDRKSGYVVADKLERATTESVVKSTIQRFYKLPRPKRLTITYDNDIRFTEHEFIEKKIGADIYFANPYHSWERGTNENANGLIRQFFPKQSPFASITSEQLQKTVDLLNNRPRKRHHYLTPKEVFNSS